MSNKDTKGYGPRVFVSLKRRQFTRNTNGVVPVASFNPGKDRKEYLPLAEHDAKLKLIHGMLDECDGLLGERDAKIAALEDRVKELQDYAQKAEDKICTLEDQLESERKKREELEKHLETERMRLSACGVAALGYYQEPVADEYKSASLSDVLSLRSQLAAAEEKLETYGVRVAERVLQILNAHGYGGTSVYKELLAALEKKRAATTEQHNLSPGEEK